MSIQTSASREFQFKNRRNQSLFARCWQPANRSSALVLLIHGYAEHSGRYHHVAETLLETGCLVYGFDLTGHGKSPGLTAYIDHFEDYVDDAEDALDLLKTDHPDLPVFLLGHSMGGLIAVNLALQRQNDLKGLITSGGALKVNEDLSPFLVKISGLLSIITPKIPAVKLASDLISHDPQVIKAYEDDPLIYHGGTRCRTGAEIIRASREALEHFGKLTLPLLVMHGGDDKLTDPQGSRLLYQRANSDDKTLQIFEGLRHEIFNEPQQKEVLMVVREWLNQRIR